MWPAVPSTSSSTRFARSFQTLLTSVVPSYVTHVVEPVSGCTRRDRCVFHVPISKSKSCWPSRWLVGCCVDCGRGCRIKTTPDKRSHVFIRASEVMSHSVLECTTTPRCAARRTGLHIPGVTSPPHLCGTIKVPVCVSTPVETDTLGRRKPP